MHNKKGENRKFSPCNFYPKNRKGQFYLIAAIIIVAIAAGFITIFNSVSSQQNTDIYYLREEIKIESSKTIDYSVQNNADFRNTMINFSEQYTNNTYGYNFYFIFGTGSSATFLAYQSSSANITLNSFDETSSTGTGRVYIKDFVPVSNQANLSIDGNNYAFNFEAGNNYGFIISKKSGGQTYLVRSGKFSGSGISGEEYTFTERIIFASSAIYDGNLNGLAGADIECNDLADDNTALQGKTFIAWMSNSTLNAINRVTGNLNFDFVRTDGVIVANDSNDLIDGSIDNPINRNEFGSQITSGTLEVWTGTNSQGTADVNHCNGFSSSSNGVRGEMGQVNVANQSWTETPPQAETSDHTCDNQKRIYCFQTS